MDLITMVQRLLERQGRIDEKLDTIHQSILDRQTTTDERLNGIDSRLERLDGRVDKLENRKGWSKPPTVQHTDDAAQQPIMVKVMNNRYVQIVAALIAAGLSAWGALH